MFSQFAIILVVFTFCHHASWFLTVCCILLMLVLNALPYKFLVFGTLRSKSHTVLNNRISNYRWRNPVRWGEVCRVAAAGTGWNVQSVGEWCKCLKMTTYRRHVRFYPWIDLGLFFFLLLLACRCLPWITQVEQVSQLVTFAEGMLEFHSQCADILRVLVETLNEK